MSKKKHPETIAAQGIQKFHVLHAKNGKRGLTKTNRYTKAQKNQLRISSRTGFKNKFSKNFKKGLDIPKGYVLSCRQAKGAAVSNTKQKRGEAKCPLH
jgi:hypothetical protein